MGEVKQEQLQEPLRLLAALFPQLHRPSRRNHCDGRRPADALAAPRRVTAQQERRKVGVEDPAGDDVDRGAHELVLVHAPHEGLAERLGDPAQLRGAHCEEVGVSGGIRELRDDGGGDRERDRGAKGVEQVRVRKHRVAAAGRQTAEGRLWRGHRGATEGRGTCCCSCCCSCYCCWRGGWWRLWMRGWGGGGGGVGGGAGGLAQASHRRWQRHETQLA